MDNEELLAVHIHLKRKKQTAHLSGKRKGGFCSAFCLPHTLTSMAGSEGERERGKKAVMMGTQAAKWIDAQSAAALSGQWDGAGRRRRRPQARRSLVGSCLRLTSPTASGTCGECRGVVLGSMYLSPPALLFLPLICAHHICPRVLCRKASESPARNLNGRPLCTPPHDAGP
jgi:hypothetical protein